MQGYKVKEKTAIVPPVSKLSGHPACAISAYQHLSCELQPLSWRGVLDTTLCHKVRQ